MLKDEEFMGYPNAPDKVAFPGNFSHPEGAVAYFTGGFQPSPANREIIFPDGTQVFPPTDYQSDVVGNISFDHFDDGTEGGGWMIGGPADNPAASLWVQGNSGPAALQQNANIANQHYNYIYTDNEWGY